MKLRMGIRVIGLSLLISTATATAKAQLPPLLVKFVKCDSLMNNSPQATLKDLGQPNSASGDVYAVNWSYTDDQSREELDLQFKQGKLQLVEYCSRTRMSEETTLSIMRYVCKSTQAKFNLLYSPQVVASQTQAQNTPNKSFGGMLVGKTGRGVWISVGIDFISTSLPFMIKHSLDASKGVYTDVLSTNPDFKPSSISIFTPLSSNTFLLSTINPNYNMVRTGVLAANARTQPFNTHILDSMDAANQPQQPNSLSGSQP